MAFTLIMGARHSLAPPSQAGTVTTPQASRHATDRIVAPPYRALDAGLRPGPFPDRAASLLPGLLAATRTGLPPAGDDELTNTKKHHGATSRCHLPFCWAHEKGSMSLPGAFLHEPRSKSRTTHQARPNRHVSASEDDYSLGGIALGGNDVTLYPAPSVCMSTCSLPTTRGKAH